MKLPRILFLLLCGHVVFASAPERQMSGRIETGPLTQLSETQVTFSKQELSGLKLIAHRGYTPAAPENSMPAFRFAGEHKYWAIETDVHATKDGVLVCNHDATIDRTFNGKGAIKDMTLAELYQYKIAKGNNLGSYPDSELRIPLFREYLQACKDHGALPFIEHKTGNVAGVIAEARQYFEDKDIVISSSNFAILAQARAISREIFVHHIFSSADWIDDVSALGNSGMAFDYTDLQNPETLATVRDLIARAHAAGIKVCLRAGDDRTRVKRMIELGLDYIPTNVTTLEGLRSDGAQPVLHPCGR